MKSFAVKLLFILLVVSMLMLAAGCKASTRGEEALDVEAVTTEEAVSNLVVSSTGLIVAEAAVVPAQYAVLSFITGGVIVEVLAEEGDEVAEGEVIARLEGKERLESAIAAAELALLSAQQGYDDLFENHDLMKAEAQYELAAAERALDRAQDQLSSKEYTKGDTEQIEGAYAEYILAQEALDDAQEDFDEVADRLEDDLTRADRMARLAAARDRVDKAWSRWDYLRSLPDTLEVSEAEAQVELAKARLDKAQEDNEKLADGPDPEDVELAEAQIKNAEAQLLAAKMALEDIQLEAPFDGILISSALKVGELASPGVTTVTLADDSVWEIETTDLTEIDVVDVKEGAPVTITFDALPDLELTGKVARIKSLGENKQGDITYTVTVELDDSDPRLRWNMTAYVSFEE